MENQRFTAKEVANFQMFIDELREVTQPLWDDEKLILSNKQIYSFVLNIPYILGAMSDGSYSFGEIFRDPTFEYATADLSHDIFNELKEMDNSISDSEYNKKIQDINRDINIKYWHKYESIIFEAFYIYCKATQGIDKYQVLHKLGRINRQDMLNPDVLEKPEWGFIKSVGISPVGFDKTNFTMTEQEWEQLYQLPAIILMLTASADGMITKKETEKYDDFLINKFDHFNPMVRHIFSTGQEKLLSFPVDDMNKQAAELKKFREDINQTDAILDFISNNHSFTAYHKKLLDCVDIIDSKFTFFEGFEIKKAILDMMFKLGIMGGVILTESAEIALIINLLNLFELHAGETSSKLEIFPILSGRSRVEVYGSNTSTYFLSYIENTRTVNRLLNLIEYKEFIYTYLYPLYVTEAIVLTLSEKRIERINFVRKVESPENVEASKDQILKIEHYLDSFNDLIQKKLCISFSDLKLNKRQVFAYILNSPFHITSRFGFGLISKEVDKNLFFTSLLPSIFSDLKSDYESNITNERFDSNIENLKPSDLFSENPAVKVLRKHLELSKGFDKYLILDRISRDMKDLSEIQNFIKSHKLPIEIETFDQSKYSFTDDEWTRIYALPYQIYYLAAASEAPGKMLKRIPVFNKHISSVECHPLINEINNKGKEIFEKSNKDYTIGTEVIFLKKISKSLSIAKQKLNTVDYFHLRLSLIWLTKLVIDDYVFGETGEVGPQHLLKSNLVQLLEMSGNHMLISEKTIGIQQYHFSPYTIEADFIANYLINEVL
jgi:hypothetical protein